MIITETVEINGEQYVKHYSDKGYYIKRDGVEYSEAIDPLNTGRVYEETETLIDPDFSEEIEKTDENQATEEDYRKALIELGVELND